MSKEVRLSHRAARAGSQPIGNLMHLALARPELVSLAAGFVDSASLPIDATRSAIGELLSAAEQGRAALQYGTTRGYPPLREALIERLSIADGLAAAARPTLDQVVVTGGSNQFLHLVSDTLLDPGDIVLTAAPTYFVYLGILANLGARSVGVATDGEGMLPAALEEELQRIERRGELGRVKAIYVNSYFDNPAGTTLPAARRAEIFNIARRWSRAGIVYVIEDAAYRELRYFGDDIPSLYSFDAEGDTVIHVGSFSKSFSPGIRVGWGVLPPALVEPVCNQKGNIDFGSPNFSQHLMAAVLAQGHFDPHVNELRRCYRDKLCAMLQAADRHLAPLGGMTWQQPGGGLYVWLTLPVGVDSGPQGRLLTAALDEGVLYVPGEYCYPAEGSIVGRNTIRLSFGVQDAGGIERGIAALARAVQRVC